MGFIKWLFGKTPTFKPDFSKTEYDNWLDYLDKGGTTEEWERLKTENHWKFKIDKTELFINQREKLKPFEDRYYTLMEQIQTNWSKLYKSKNYHGDLARNMEKDCLRDIQYYKELWNEEKKYGKPDIRSVPAFTRLAMLYERQERYEECIEICKKAILLSVDECNRMSRMIKKVGREPNAEELQLIGEFSSIKVDKEIANTKREVSPNHIDRTKLPAEKIDTMQRIEASVTYRKKIYNKYYKNYPEIPFISQDRELNTNWIEQAELFGVTPTKEMMTRYSDGLLPGHIYLLYWLDKYTNKRIPAYFEYKYGINVEEEKIFLTENGYLLNEKTTAKGNEAIKKHYDVIENHSPKKTRRIAMT